MKVFISHSHEDKSIARRIARFLRRYGVDAWLDERELRLGNNLEDAIQAAMADSDVVVVVASHAASRSKWVERELVFAGLPARRIDICPIYVEDTIAHPLFAPNLGIDARDRTQFAEVLVRLAESLVGTPLPAPDKEKLEAALREIASRSREVAVFVEECLHGNGLKYEHTKLVCEANFHDLDEALDAVSQLSDSFYAAAATSAIFAQTGAGSATISRYLAQGHDVLNSAVGLELNPAFVPAAIRLLSAANPRHDQSLASFLWKNAGTLEVRRSDLVHLVTFPSRGPRNFAADAVAAALDIFPADNDLVLLWSRWIRSGLFDGSEVLNAETPDCFAFWSSRGLENEASGWSRIFDVFVSYLRNLVRQTDRRKVDLALRHMMAAADRGNPRFRELVRECSNASGTAEWEKWSDKAEMSHHVRELTTEALGNRKWHLAMRRAEENFHLERDRSTNRRESGEGL